MCPQSPRKKPTCIALPWKPKRERDHLSDWVETNLKLFPSFGKLRDKTRFRFHSSSNRKIRVFNISKFCFHFGTQLCKYLERYSFLYQYVKVLSSIFVCGCSSVHIIVKVGWRRHLRESIQRFLWWKHTNHYCLLELELILKKI